MQQNHAAIRLIFGCMSFVIGGKSAVSGHISGIAVRFLQKMDQNTCDRAASADDLIPCDVFLADSGYVLQMAQNDFKSIRFHFTSEF